MVTINCYYHQEAKLMHHGNAETYNEPKQFDRISQKAMIS